MIDLQTIITDVELLHRRTLFREGFAFTSLANIGNAANIFDAIIIRNPKSASCFTPKLGFSSKTLQEHINFINNHQLEKAVVIAEDISFLLECPSLRYLQVIPSDNAKTFDFSPLYKMPDIMGLNCATEYGLHLLQKAAIDYKNFSSLLDLDAAGAGNINIKDLHTIQRLNVSRNPARKFEDMVPTDCLRWLSITECRLNALSGISQANKLAELSLWYNRSLADISEIALCAASLKSLSIGMCSKVADFSFLEELQNLEELELIGGNELPNLNFLPKMRALKVFVFNMNVLDGDLSNCLSVPYVYSQRNRKHYNLSNSDLPKNTVTKI